MQIILQTILFSAVNENYYVSAGLQKENQEQLFNRYQPKTLINSG